MKDYTPNGVVVGVETTVVAANKLAAYVELNMFFLFHMFSKILLFE